MQGSGVTRLGDLPLAARETPPAGRDRARSGDEPTPEADGYGVGSRPGLKLGQDVPDVALHRLFREEEPRSDLAVHEAVGDELQNLDLTRRRILGARREARRRELDH